MFQDPEILKNSAKEWLEEAKKVIKYGDIGSLVRSSLAEYFVEHGGGFIWSNSKIINDRYGKWDFQFSDETNVWLGEAWQMILEEVVIAVVAIAIGAVTWGVGAVAIYAAKFAAQWTKLALKGRKVTKIFKLMKSLSKLKKITWTATKGAKKARTAWKEAEKMVKAAKNLNKAIKVEKKAEKLGKSIDKTQKIKAISELKNLEKINQIVHIKDFKQISNLTHLTAKGSHLICEGVGFHLSSTILRNALSGESISKGLDPFSYTEGPNGERNSNFRGYIQSIAFLWILKAIGQPLQNLTGAGLQKLLGEKIAISNLGKALTQIGSVGAEFGSLMITEQTLNLAFDQKFAPITIESAVQSLWMILGLRAFGWAKIKIKAIREWKNGIQQIVVEKQSTGEEINVNADGKVIASTSKDIPVGKNILEPQKQSPKQQSESSPKLNNSTREKELFDQFSEKIFSKEGVKVDGHTYNYSFENNNTHNSNRKGRIKLLKDGKTIRSVNADVNLLPENANWRSFKKHFEILREQYINENRNSSSEKNINSELESKKNQILDQIKNIESNQQELQQQLDILSNKKENSNKKQQELQKRKIELEKRKTELLQQRQQNWNNLDKSNHGIDNITTILQKRNIITIDGLKYQFIGIKNGKAEFIIEKMHLIQQKNNEKNLWAIFQ